MRTQVNKLTRGHSTKSERRFLELLKALHIPFRTKVMMNGYEIDFVVGEFAIELDAHKQNVEKNVAIIKSGYVPFHLFNWEVTKELVAWLQKIHNRFTC